ncbi:hypothetical protein LAB1_41310 [Roseibium sp. LAB1]
MIGKVRQFYLGALRSEDLNTRFGGPLFVFILLSMSLLLLATWIRDDGGAFTFAHSVGVAENEDFAAFYRAGEMARLGIASDAYDYYRFTAAFSESNKFLFFLNPPHAFLFFEPLTYLDYPGAKAVFMVLSVLCLLMSIHMTRLKLGLWPYVFVLLSSGTLYSFQLLQLSPITTFLLLFALLFSRTRPVLAGLALAVLTIKPQYGILAPVFLAANRDWRAFAVAALGTCGLIALSIAVYGLEVWQAFFTSLSSGVHAVQFEVLHNMMVTVGNSLGKFGVEPAFRKALQLLAILCLGVAVWFLARRRPREEAVAFCLLGMCLAAPSFLFYDWLIYSMALLLLVKVRPNWPIALQAAAGLLWCAPVLHDIVDKYDPTAAFYFSGSILFLSLLVLALAFACFRKAPATGSVARCQIPMVQAP